MPILRYVALLVVYIVCLVVAIIINPTLPLFAQMVSGRCDNANAIAKEPRLPNWLSWFSTNHDNSLWGDKGWRTLHCPTHWNTYWGMVQWLYRNPCAGFGWSVLAHCVEPSETFTVSMSPGASLALDKRRGADGWYMIRSSRGAFQFRWVKDWLGKRWDFEAGWLLDVYVKGGIPDDAAKRYATFMFQPGLPKAIP